MIVLIFMLLNCKRYVSIENNIKVIGEDVELAGNLVELLGLDEPIKSIIDILTLPITLSSEFIQNKVRKYIESLKDKKDRGYKDLLTAIIDGNSIDAFNALSQLDISSIYLDKSVDTNTRIYPINIAIKRDMSKIVDLMIEKGVNISIQDDEGTTPLMFAIKMGREKIFSLILNNLDENLLNMKDKKHYNALHWAILSNKSDIFVGPLLEKGAKIVISPNNKLNELHFASLAGNYNAVVEIIDKYEKEYGEQKYEDKNEENDKDKDGEKYFKKNKLKDKLLKVTNGYRQTAFHFAAISGSEDVYRYISEKIDPSKKETFLPLDIIGASPLHYLALNNLLKPTRGKLVDKNEVFQGLSLNIDNKLNLLDYILGGDHKLIIENKDKTVNSVSISLSSGSGSDTDEKKRLGSSSRPFKKKGDIIKSHPILNKTTRGLIMLHYNAYYGGKNVFRKAIQRLERDLRRKVFSLDSVNHLETKENKNDSSISSSSILDIAYQMGKKDIFKYIVNDLPQDLKLDLSGIDVYIESEDVENNLICDLNGYDKYEIAKIKLYMLIIGYKVEKRRKDNNILFISQNRVEQLLDKIEKHDMELRLLLNNSIINKLLRIEYVNKLENFVQLNEDTLKFKNDLNRSIRFEQENLKGLIDEDRKDTKEDEYIHIIPYTLNPVEAVDILIESLRKKGINETEIKGVLNSYSEGKRIIHIAVENNLLILTESLLDRGVDIIIEDKDATTPFHIAAEKGYKEMLILLCSRIPDKLIKSKQLWKDTAGKFPLDYAIEKGNIECVEVLVENFERLGTLFSKSKVILIDFVLRSKSDKLRENILSKNINYVDLDKDNILSISVKNNLERSVEYILENHPNIINNENIYGETPLHIAARNRRFKSFLNLIEKGSNPNISDNEGFNPVFRLLFSLNKDDLSKEDRVTICKIIKNKNIDISKKHVDGCNCIFDTKAVGFIDVLISKELYLELAAFFEREDIYTLIREYNRYSLLSSIVKLNQYDLVKKLLEVYIKVDKGKQLNVCSRTSIKESIVYLAVKNMLSASFKALFDFGKGFKNLKMNIPLDFLIYSSIKHSTDNDLDKRFNLVDFIIKRVIEETEKENKRLVKEYTKKIKKGELLTYPKEYSLKEYIKEKYLNRLKKESGEKLKIKDFCEDGEDKTLKDYLRGELDNKVCKELRDKNVLEALNTTSL